MVAAVSPTLITELDAAVRAGSPERGDRILKQVTTFSCPTSIASAALQISVLNDVLIRLIERSETGPLAQLQRTLCNVELAPPTPFGKLASHGDPLVATPVLKHSRRVQEKDLIEIARTHSQQHLLAIAERKTLSEALTDTLMRRGDASVSNALARNPGAVFSEYGYATLVGRAERDEALTEELGLRLDIPADCCGISGNDDRRGACAIFDSAPTIAREKQLRRCDHRKGSTEEGPIMRGRWTRWSRSTAQPSSTIRR